MIRRVEIEQKKPSFNHCFQRLSKCFVLLILIKLNRGFVLSGNKNGK